MTSMTTHLFKGTTAETVQLQALVNKWNARCDVIRLNAVDSHAVNALDFDLLSKLLLLLPYIITLFTGGFTAAAILTLLKQVIAMVVPDLELQNTLLQILTILVELWSKK